MILITFKLCLIEGKMKRKKEKSFKFELIFVTENFKIFKISFFLIFPLIFPLPGKGLRSLGLGFESEYISINVNLHLHLLISPLLHYSWATTNDKFEFSPIIITIVVEKDPPFDMDPLHCKWVS